MGEHVFFNVGSVCWSESDQQLYMMDWLVKIYCFQKNNPNDFSFSTTMLCWVECPTTVKWINCNITIVQLVLVQPFIIQHIRAIIGTRIGLVRGLIFRERSIGKSYEKALWNSLTFKSLINKTITLKKFLFLSRNHIALLLQYSINLITPQTQPVNRKCHTHSRVCAKHQHASTAVYIYTHIVNFKYG